MALAEGLIDRIGRRGSAYGALVAISLGGLLFALTANVGMALAVGLVWGIAWGFQETIFVALAMAAMLWQSTGSLRWPVMIYIMAVVAMASSAVTHGGGLITAGALSREESRGVHFRTDFPERDDRRWKRSITWQREG